jgi:transcriptional regulator with XRE-family HTH domain
MQNYKLGEYIRQRRLDLGLTQEQVCAGICESVTLSRFENGKQTPSRNRINAILQRLGLPDDRYYALVTPEELEIEALKKQVEKLTSAKRLSIDIKEVKRPDKDAQLVAENIAQQLENRISFRRAMKSCMGRTMKQGAKGIKTSCSGRLGGADMARTEFYSEGTIPLQTLRADIDYGFAEANTTYGKVGVKVWIYEGEVLPTKTNKEGSDK